MATMKIAVAGKMPQRALPTKKRTSGPMSSASLRAGWSCGFLSMAVSTQRLPRCHFLNSVRAGSGLQPSNRLGKVTRLEWREVIHAFADANEVNGQAMLLGDCDQNAAARAAVELGHGEPRDTGNAGKLLDLRQCVLADGGVEHQQHRVRRGRLELLQHPHDLFQFAH